MIVSENLKEHLTKPFELSETEYNHMEEQLAYMQNGDKRDRLFTDELGDIFIKSTYQRINPEFLNATKNINYEGEVFRVPLFSAYSVFKEDEFSLRTNRHKFSVSDDSSAIRSKVSHGLHENLLKQLLKNYEFAEQDQSFYNDGAFSVSKKELPKESVNTIKKVNTFKLERNFNGILTSEARKACAKASKFFDKIYIIEEDRFDYNKKGQILNHQLLMGLISEHSYHGEGKFYYITEFKKIMLEDVLGEKQ